jgi:hypothetical protein
MRYISAPQRSHFIASSLEAGFDASADTTGVTINFGMGLDEGSSTPAL